MGYGIEIVGVDGGGVFKVQDTDNIVSAQKRSRKI